MTDQTTDPRALVERLTGYTPGPWHIENCQTYVDRGTSFYQEVWSDKTDVLVSTEVTRAHGDGGAANMRLIAAAPDILAALTAALDRAEKAEAERDELDALLNEGIATDADTRM
jgi:hypothetical protein